MINLLIGKQSTLLFCHDNPTDHAYCRYGDEIGRLSIAQELVQKALEVPKKGVVPAVYDDLASMRSHVATLLKTAIK